MNFLNEKIWSATIEEAKAKAVASPEWLRAIAKLTSYCAASPYTDPLMQAKVSFG